MTFRKGDKYEKDRFFHGVPGGAGRCFVDLASEGMRAAPGSVG